MRLLLAYRFLRSKSNSSFINIISKISVLGIILGISILITVISVMNGFEKELKDKVLGFTSHVTAYSNDMEKISYDIFDNHIRDGEILGYSPYIEKEIMLSSAHATVSSLFRAIEPNLEKNVGETHNNIISGDYDDLVRINNSIIIGSGVANKLRVNVGDDVNDYEIMKKCALACSPNDATKKIKDISHYICNKNGGDGVLREVADLILDLKN